MNRRTWMVRGLSVLGAAHLLTPRAWAADPLRMAYFDNFSPFSWLDEQGGMQGIFIDALNEVVSRRMQIAVTHGGYPWARAQQMVEKGGADAFCTVPTPARRLYTEVSAEPVITATFTLFTLRGGAQLERLKSVKTLEDLRPFTIGHYIGSGWAKQKLEGMQMEWAPNVDAVLKKLVMGRGDVHIDVAEVLRPRIKALGLSDSLLELPQVLDTQPFNLCIRKDSPHVQWLPKFDNVMRQFREDGSLEAIYRKYGALPAGVN